jgi:hypothetical protein
VTTTVGSRSLLGSVVRGACSGDGWVRGTLGNAPAREGVRGSGGDDDGGSSPEVENEADAFPWRGSRAGPGQSQIERGLSAGAVVAPAVANAGVKPGSAGGVGGLGGVGGAGAEDGGAATPGVIVISGWSVMASPIVRSVASLVASSIGSGVASPSWSSAPGELPS